MTIANPLPVQNNTWDAAAVVAQHYHHRAAAFMAASQPMQNNTLFLAVTQPVQLAAALAQREKAVIIADVPENKNLRLLLKFALWSQSIWIVGWLLTHALNLGYGIDIRTEWQGKLFKNEIILTPHGGSVY
jgi:hypothetical protein